MGHALYVLALSLCFVELLLAECRKIPLTCPVPGFRDNFLLLCLIQFFGFKCFTRLGAGAEHWMFAEPVRFLLVPGSMLAAWLCNRQRLASAGGAPYPEHRGAGVAPAMPVFVPAFFEERRPGRRRGNLKGRST
jgi:hypothetical protein